ncbi:hypothetical protein [Aquimarina brevivitae]|uniref:Carboxypeptidase-like protein n=1 Tax=Aquimarina brevivitae TaxID=323412 RepID=A0A4V2F586_9FLAO|nr:hypothetical protein [Aquimarina brevivitae]RZS91949.1 hypothetical protein EV197_3053 [Aquimarina brevivitae]
MQKILITVAALMITTCCTAQSDFFEGLIIADSLQGYAINIVNYTKKVGVTNNDEGRFKIVAGISDTIVFSSVQYEVKTLVVNANHLNHSQEILLDPIVEQLPVVNISSTTLSGVIANDVKIVEIKPFVNNRTLGLPFRDIEQPTPEERRLYTAASSNGALSVDFIINTISGKIKKLKKHKAISRYEKTIEKGRTSFATQFFIEELGIPEELIADFIYYSSEDQEFEKLLQPAATLDLLLFFEEKALAYKKHKQL